jgi:hypothetical protein
MKRRVKISSAPRDAAELSVWAKKIRSWRKSGKTPRHHPQRARESLIRRALPSEFEAKAIVVKVRKEIHFIGSWKPLDLSAHRNPSVLEFL